MTDWVWNSQRVPGGIEVRIGAVLIARIGFIRAAKEVNLQISGNMEYHPDVSTALKRIHHLLKSPPSEKICP